MIEVLSLPKEAEVKEKPFGIALCSIKELAEISSFQEKHLSADNKDVYSPEFLCPLGLRAAVKKNQVVVARENGKVIGMARFYITKRYGHASLYQFAIVETHRGKGILKQMLGLVGDKPVISRCPSDLNLNAYYRKTGWSLKSQDEHYIYWQLETGLKT